MGRRENQQGKTGQVLIQRSVKILLIIESHKFNRNLGATSKFYDLVWSKFYTEDPTILGAKVQNFSRQGHVMSEVHTLLC
jgi:hypothetical protein